MADRDDHLVCAGVGYTLLNIYSECQRINVGTDLRKAGRYSTHPRFITVLPFRKV